jgi:hypothetical protein
MEPGSASGKFQVDVCLCGAKETLRCRRPRHRELITVQLNSARLANSGCNMLCHRGTNKLYSSTGEPRRYGLGKSASLGRECRKVGGQKVMMIERGGPDQQGRSCSYNIPSSFWAGFRRAILVCNRFRRDLPRALSRRTLPAEQFCQYQAKG